MLCEKKRFSEISLMQDSHLKKQMDNAINGNQEYG